MKKLKLLMLSNTTMAVSPDNHGQKKAESEFKLSK